MRPFINNRPFDQKAYESHVKALNDVLDKFERCYLMEHSFIMGDEITIADLLGMVPSLSLIKLYYYAA